ncbi:hypothetical protein TREMEDRAFT_66542 [Tremella mesenterica DSM 1558]|uniref:uncharacterized protein n=1 Tax=Tremella mesenterica (strain ATCC 24925 / CBS 8224 / DSM 1558 / NBRC 9311 / NRRL Y-6157 / RJB 2259-6 / UBC 559-6) TaxID=578456 RepID=UPI00032B9D15|nr:uncharacterized protein TREMEDRAFT_66542 [Tremella mesenterica DSM 1558]EIW65477.1 hypothetical protein TREMEDRAFT_66542 [Tremella mesenterica DSM 1558]
MSSPSPSSSSKTSRTRNESYSPDAKLQKTRYATYRSLVRDLGIKIQGGLAERLLPPALHQGEEADLQGHTNGPEEAAKDFSTLWPDLPEDDPPGVSLEDTIVDFASAYIRRKGLLLPNRPTSTDREDENENAPYDTVGQEHGRKGRPKKQCESSRLYDEALQDVDEPPLPPEMVRRVVERLDKTLVGLAVIRPAQVGSMRRRLKTLGWEDVLRGSLLVEQDPTQAHIRLREMYPHSADPDGTPMDPGLLSHRRKIVANAMATPCPTAEEDDDSPYIC